jgi:hypothetical protein
MASKIPQAIWKRYRKIIRDAHDTFSQDVVIWKRAVEVVLLYNEDNNISNYDNVELKVLIGYNYFRTWPITRKTGAGEIDEQNMIIIINKDYLNELGYINAQGMFNFKPDKDLFLHRGILYKPEGDTPISQAYDDPLHVLIILRREETETGTDRLNQT